MLDRLPVRPELERRLERLFVAIGGRVAYIHPVARVDRPAPQFGFDGCATHEMLGRRDPAQRFLEEDRADGRIGAQCIQMLRLVAQYLDRTHERRGGRVMARCSEAKILAKRTRRPPLLTVHGTALGYARGRLGPKEVT